MADSKITALTALTTLTNDDVFAVVDDPSGTPVSKKITTNDLFKLPAGTTALAPIRFTSGTNLTTAEAGAMEYDGTVHYSSHAASARGVSTSEQFITLTSAYTIPTEGGGLRAMFNSPASGAITVKGSTAYWFECMGSISSLSTSSGTFSFGLLGTASISTIRYISSANKAVVTPATAQMTNVSTTASTALNTANIVATAQFTIMGKLTVDTGGTIIPAIGHSVIANPIIGVGSTFRIYPMGADSVQSVGRWS